MNKRFISDTQLKGYVNDICRQISVDKWTPDYVVGITRGGLIPAVLVSHYFNVPMHALGVSLRDGNANGPESNCWMSEDAFGYVSSDDQEVYKSRWDISMRSNILIVDDINDSGATLNWIKHDWESSCFPDKREVWDTVWNHNVRFATIVDNLGSEFDGRIDYTALEINKDEDDSWIVFPYEQWWLNAD